MPAEEVPRRLKFEHLANVSKSTRFVRPMLTFQGPNIRRMSSNTRQSNTPFRFGTTGGVGTGLRGRCDASAASIGRHLPPPRGFIVCTVSGFGDGSLTVRQHPTTNRGAIRPHRVNSQEPDRGAAAASPTRIPQPRRAAGKLPHAAGILVGSQRSTSGRLGRVSARSE